MGSLSDFAENEVLDHIFGVGAYSPPATVYIGLSTADPLDTGAGLAEPGVGDYAREAITFAAASSRTISQTGAVTFNEATASWGTISHYALFDQVSGGNMLAHGALSSSKAVASGNTPSIADGEVDVSVDSGAMFTSYANQVLDWLFRAQSLPQPDITIGLSKTIPTDAGNVTEPPSGEGAYGRKAHSAWDTASGGATENTGAITFTEATSSWGTIVYCVICDGFDETYLLYGDVTDQAVGNGDTVEFADGDLDVTLD
jgi:hypothetical protein